MAGNGAAARKNEGGEEAFSRGPHGEAVGDLSALGDGSEATERR